MRAVRNFGRESFLRKKSHVMGGMEGKDHERMEIERETNEGKWVERRNRKIKWKRTVKE